MAKTNKNRTLKTEKDFLLLREEVDLFFKKNTRKVYADDGSVEYKLYNRHRWYVKIEKVFLGDMEEFFSPSDYKMFTHITSKIKQSKDVFTSGVVFMKYSAFEKIISRRTFNDVLAKFIKVEFLIATNYKYYYMINPKKVIIAFSPEEKKRK